MRELGAQIMRFLNCCREDKPLPELTVRKQAQIRTAATIIRDERPRGQCSDGNYRILTKGTDVVATALMTRQGDQDLIIKNEAKEVDGGLGHNSPRRAGRSRGRWRSSDVAQCRR